MDTTGIDPQKEKMDKHVALFAKSPDLGILTIESET